MHKARVLLVEDDKDLRESLVECLELAGLEVEAAGCAMEFYQILSSADAAFEIAVVDIGLPDQSGFEMTRFLRHNTAMGVIILTARNSIKDRVQGYDSGADLYFVKPIDCLELAAAIRNLSFRMAGRKSEGETPTSSEWLFEKRHWRLTTPWGKTIKFRDPQNWLFFPK